MLKYSEEQIEAAQELSKLTQEIPEISAGFFPSSLPCEFLKQMFDVEISHIAVCRKRDSFERNIEKHLNNYLLFKTSVGFFEFNGNDAYMGALNPKSIVTVYATNGDLITFNFVPYGNGFALERGDPIDILAEVKNEKYYYTDSRYNKPEFYKSQLKIEPVNFDGFYLASDKPN